MPGDSISAFEFGKFVGDVNRGIKTLEDGQKTIHKRLDTTNKDAKKLGEDFNKHLVNHPALPNGRFAKVKAPAKTVGWASAAIAVVELIRYVN